ncbi:MAG TPA: glutathione S-transferase family protein [Polyangiaceae bacterium]|nr:glutathione S-transferase family protein [Polyangiaceae bacterium]
MNDDLIFYHNPMSRGRIAHWMLEEVGTPYEMKLVNFEKREHKAPEFLAINPMGKLPAIVHRGTVVTEAAAICTYLADAFPEARLAPAVNDPVRGTYLRWLFFGAGCIEPALVDRMLDRAAAPPSSLGYGSYADVLDALEKAVTPGPFILGERFSAADVYVGSQIGWGLMVKSLEPRPAFLAYVDRWNQRPAFQRVLAQTNELVEKLKAGG